MADVKLLFMDESLNNETGFPLSSLTGLLVAAEKYSDARAGVYAAIEDVIQPKPGQIHTHPPELHFSNFLPDRPDKDKFEVLRKLVDNVNACKIKLIRVAHYITPALRELFKPDHNLIGACWFGMTTVLGPILRDSLVIPILDAGFDAGFRPTVARFSQLVQSTAALKAAGLGEFVSIKGSENLAEVVYGDSQFSALIQLTDAVAGLRRISETFRETGKPPKSAYKQRLLEISGGLEQAIDYEQAIAIRLNGEIQGPADAPPPKRPSS